MTYGLITYFLSIVVLYAIDPAIFTGFDYSVDAGPLSMFPAYAWVVPSIISGSTYGLMSSHFNTPKEFIVGMGCALLLLMVLDAELPPIIHVFPPLILLMPVLSGCISLCVSHSVIWLKKKNKHRE